MDAVSTVMDGSRVYVVEGIPGSGKDTFCQMLEGRHDATGEAAYYFEEESLLQSWKHFSLKNIDRLRLGVMESVMDWMKAVLAHENKSIFILNRFHVSFIRLNKEPALIPRYDRVIEGLQGLGAKVVITLIPQDNVELFALRVARDDRHELWWQRFRETRPRESSFGDWTTFYMAQQEEILRIVRKQPLSYQVVVV